MRKTILVLAVAGAICSANAMAQADNTNSKIDPAMTPYKTWMHDSAARNHGYITRQEYMDEMGRRWDRMDAEHKGLTTAQINSLYGYDTRPSAPDHTMVNKGSARTNPTGTELKGESGG